MARPRGAASRGAKRILVADIEPGIRLHVGRALAAAGYVPDFAASGTQALARALECHYDLIILDLVMPDMEGTCLLDRILSERPEQAVIVVSRLDNTATKVDCLERGAQDYLTKPFSLAELLARIRLRLREDAASLNHPVNSAEAARTGEVIRAGGLALDVAHLAADAGRGPVPLTRLEFMLLRELAEHVGQPVPKDLLLKTVWGSDFAPRSNILDVCVRRLRSKLGVDRIVTVRGEGYQLVGRLPGSPCLSPLPARVRDRWSSPASPGRPRFGSRPIYGRRITVNRDACGSPSSLPARLGVSKVTEEESVESL